MGYYRVVAEGSQFPEAQEKIVATALEAQTHVLTFQRICGKYGKVEVWSNTGEKIALAKLDRNAMAEKGN